MPSDVDPDAFAHIVERFTPMVLARCQRELGPADADDAVQAVFLVLWRRWDEAPTQGPGLSSWLYQTAGLVVKRAHRDRGRRRRAEQHAGRPAGGSPAVEAGPDTDLDASEARRHLDAALAALPSAQREAVVMSHLSGHSYATVAVHQGCSKATVANRVRDGLDALRRSLARRGCALSVAALGALLGSEASAAVPPGLQERLHRLSSACRDGTTAAVLGATILRWSRRELPVMRIIGTSAASLALAAWLLWPGSAPDAVAADAPIAAAAPAAEPRAGDPLERWESMRADQVVYLRWHRPARTWARVLETPLGTMVPPAVAESVAAQLAGIDRIEVAIDPASNLADGGEALLTPELKRASVLALEGDPEAMRQAATGAIRMVLSQQKDEIRKLATDVASFDGMPAQHIEARVVVSDPAARARIRSLIDGGFGGRVTWRPEGGRLVADGKRCRLEAGDVADGIALQLRPEWCTRALPTVADAPWDETHDLEMRSVLLPRHPETYAAAVRMPVAGSFLGLDVQIWLDQGEARMRSFMPTQPGQRVPVAASPLAASAWRVVPAEALIAGACRITAGDTLMQSLVVGAIAPALMTSRADGADALMAACVDLAYGVDGELVGYVQMGTPLPSLTLALSAAPAYATPFVTELGRQPGATTGEDGRVRFASAFAVVEVGQRDGRLIVTTDPAGIDGFRDQGEAFATAPDVAAGLAAGGGAPSSGRLVMRTGKLLELALPMASLAGMPPEQVQQLAQATAKLRQRPESGWLVARGGADGARAEAGGAVALLAAMMLAMPMAPRGVN